MILENNKNFDTIFIQELSWSTIWSTIWSISSLISEEGKLIVGASNHLLYIMFLRYLVNDNKHPRAITYINIWLTQLGFSLRKDIINYRNINLISFFNNDIIHFIINIYSNEQQSTLKYLKNIEINLNNVLIITEDFNIRNNNWNLLYFHYLAHTDIIMEIANSFNLSLFTPIIQVSTQYTDNSNNSNSVIDLIPLS